MEDETASGIVENGGTDVMMVEEASDSNSSNFQTHVTNCLVRHDDDNSSISSVTKFKGVVPQQNGHWGAQIYCNHKRIWLGTFKTERDAAMAYDSASIKLRSGDSHRNFPWTNSNIQEPDFQTLHSTEAVLNMIKDGSYPSKFVEYLTLRSGKAEIGINLVKLQENGGFLCQQLFQKELTPSDVGKLNRLVIPKKYAVKYFPPISENNAAQEENTIADDLELAFYDRLMISWKFRYCYWSSSQSFVFTRGWNRFVREKELKAKDIVTFYTFECKEGEKKGQTFCMIDIWYEKDRRNEDVDHQYVDVQLEPEPNIGSEKDQELQEELGLVETTQNSVKSSFRLFGVQICS